MMDALCVEAEFALLGFSTCRKVVFLWEWCVKVQRIIHEIRYTVEETRLAGS
jgi:hypothetical protein